MKNFSKTVALSLFSLTVFSGCASMFGDNTRQLKVDSRPQGADIYVDGLRYGTTPATITLPTYIYGGKQIVLKKDDYRDQTVVINAVFQPVGLWNLLFWPGFLIDAAAGNSVKIEPANLNVVSDLTAVEKKGHSK